MVTGAITQKIADGGRVSADEGLTLFRRKPKLLEMMIVAEKHEVYFYRILQD